MIQPPPLEKNDQVAIIATARSITEKDLQPAIDLLKTWGLIPVLGTSIGLQEHQFAGSDKERAEDFQNQINDPKIKAIWFAKGGYGSIRLLDLVDFSMLNNQPKWLIGYSDVTAIHLHLQNMGIASLHAQMASAIETRSASTSGELKKVLFGKNLQIEYASRHTNHVNGEVKAEVLGGNLSVLYSAIGSQSMPSFKNKILFLEDLDEYLYHIDRMMQNLKRSGLLSQISGLIVGGMTDMNDNTVPFGKTAEDIIFEAVKHLNIPVAFNFPAGHVETNLPVMFGKTAQLSVTSDRVRLVF
ncbi:S66 peptidase family protein [Psychroflexus sediminis]|uniref:Muramoyltetrapeptide carboxypeptidase n=1 Tax=Psychroflexus sediminis TaxID=470826 RepID=A0A1G7YUE0_9FLAO|nr:LD-carboxypeptidase [Psychroflexus sediminis]SDH00054.1 muramoyltetrapeptide carboxypeptidase [Psychroflexus sediminis]